MMLKEKKIDFQRGCEEYIEEQGLYEIFEDMMRNLIINKPEDPVKFLIDKLEKPESKLLFLLLKRLGLKLSKAPPPNWELKHR